ncbi:MAG TPA: sterol desaturase family protein [Candidatus Dormibacteraeota bacterium]|nr:sterol desaturase family protein [Candidatus Dormibacteraeota bacterium]
MIAASIHLFACMLVFTLVERLWPSSVPQRWWRRPLLLDVCSWLIVPVAIGSGIMLAVLSTSALLKDPLWPWLVRLQSASNHLPLFLNVVTAFVAVDFLNYWLHRAYHHFPFLWSFHVMHHSSETIDWLSTLRVHPVSQMLDTAIVTALLLTMGLPLNVLVAAHALIGFAAVVTHANVPWTFGRFGCLFVSPIFHHWHHARTEPDSGPERAANFGAALSIWDMVFGTSQAANKQPGRYGAQESPGKSFVSLVLYPLRFCFRGKRVRNNQQ